MTGLLWGGRDGIICCWFSYLQRIDWFALERIRHEILFNFWQTNKQFVTSSRRRGLRLNVFIIFMT